MTAWARIAQENSEQSCGNDGAMESQHQAFHISLGISQKNARFPHSDSSGDGLFDWTKKDSKKTEGRLHKSLDTAAVSEIQDEPKSVCFKALLPLGFTCESFLPKHNP